MLWKKWYLLLSNRTKRSLSALSHAKLSIQNALLGAVSPQLRAVTVDVDDLTKTLHIIFFYDGEITDELFDLASVAIAEVDVPDYQLDDHILRLDFPQKIPDKGHYVYLRKE